MPARDPTPSSRNWSTSRSILDLVATLSMIAASAAMVLFVLSSDRSSPSAIRNTTNSVPIDIEGAWVKGRRDAPFLLLQYSDFECPFCASFARETLPKIIEKYVSAGMMRLAFRHLPLSQIHPLAMRAAQVAECAGQQGRFWEMHDRLFALESPLRDSQLQSQAVSLGLKEPAYTACMSGAATTRIQTDISSAKELGVTSTPTLFLAQKLEDQAYRVLAQFKGAAPFDEIDRTLARVLRQTGSRR